MRGVQVCHHRLFLLHLRARVRDLNPEKNVCPIAFISPAVRFYETVDKHTKPSLSNLASFTPRGFKPPTADQVVDPAKLFRVPQEQRLARPARKAAPAPKPAPPAASVTALNAASAVVPYSCMPCHRSVYFQSLTGLLFFSYRLSAGCAGATG